MYISHLSPLTALSTLPGAEILQERGRHAAGRLPELRQRLPEAAALQLSGLGHRDAGAVREVSAEEVDELFLWQVAPELGAVHREPGWM